MKEIQELEKLGLWDTYNKLPNAIRTILRMEWYGVLQDIAKRDSARITNETRDRRLCCQLKILTGYEVITKAEKKGANLSPASSILRHQNKCSTGSMSKRL